MTPPECPSTSLTPHDMEEVRKMQWTGHWDEERGAWECARTRGSP